MRQLYPNRKLALRTAQTEKRIGSGIQILMGCLCLVLTLASPLYAQKSSGQITGSVLDPNDAALPDTTVSITQLGTGLTREVKSNQDGIYSVPDLPIGVYRISASRAGFKEAVVDGVKVNVSTITRQDVTMEVGNVGERVEIVA